MKRIIKAALAASILASTATVADVRVEAFTTQENALGREIPESYVFNFNDKADFEMWMENKMETVGCRPEVNKVVIDLNYQSTKKPSVYDQLIKSGKVIDVSPEYVDMEKQARKVAARKRVKQAIAEMEANPNFVNIYSNDQLEGLAAK